jgi:Transposase
MDIWDPYVASVREHLRQGSQKTVCDKFHIAKHLGDAVDKVRRQETARCERPAIPTDGNTLRLVAESGRHGTGRSQSLCRVTSEWAEDGTGLGSERNRHGIFQLPIRAARAETFSLVARLGRTQSAASCWK